MGVEISIVIPCLNEAETIVGCIREAKAVIEREKVAAEIIIADNGSTDHSIVISKEEGARVTLVEQKGYGSALMGGIQAAKGLYILMGDADGSYDFGELPRFLAELRKGKDIVMGCRLPKGGGKIEVKAMPWLHRWLGNPVLSYLGQLFFKAPITDFHCGLRAFRRDAILSLNLQTTGMEFASEMVVKAALNGLKFGEIPITLRRDRRNRPPHLRTWRDGWRHLRFLLLYSPKWLFLYPGIALMLIGLLGCGWLLPQPRIVGNVTLDANTLLYMALLIFIGFQAVLFSFMTRIFAVNEGLLPEDPLLNKVYKVATLETGLIAGFCTLGMGAGGSVMAVSMWSAHGFGPLNASMALRIVIPSILLFMLGSQIILSSFFFSLLGLKRRYLKGFS